MTENKRYEVLLDSEFILDTETGKEYELFRTNSVYELVDLLNEQHEENQALKQTIKLNGVKKNNE